MDLELANCISSSIACALVVTSSKTCCAIGPDSLASPNTSGGKSLGSITWAGAITVSQWQIFSSWRTFPGKLNKFIRDCAASEMRLGSTPNCWALCCKKWRVNVGMSSLRSRSAGNRKRITFKRWNKSSRNAPSLTRFSRSWWVAAITRTLALIALCPPTR